MRTTKNTAGWVLAGALTTLPAMSCFATSFDTLDDHEKLQNQVILAIGNVSDISLPSIASTNPLALGNQFGIKQSAHAIGKYCFIYDGIISANAYMLIADESTIVSIAELSSYGSSIKVKIEAVTLVDCGQLRKAQRDAISRSAENLKRQMDLQNKQNKAMMDALAKQQQQIQKMQQDQRQ